MGFKKLSLFAPLFLLGADIAGAAEPSLSSPHRVDLMRLGSQRPAAHSLPSAPAGFATASSTPNFTFFDMPSSTDTEAGGLNLGAGGVASHVVGCFAPNSATAGAYDAFEYTLTTRGKTSTATMKMIGPANEDLCAYDINDSDMVVGVYAPASAPTGVEYGFELKGSRLTQLVAPYPSTCVTLASGVNDAGTLVGQYQTNADCTSDHGWAEAGFSWSNGVFTLLPGPSGAIDSTPASINTAGVIVGTALNGTETAQFGWLLQGGVYTTINYPGSVFTVPTGINDSGDIVGYYCADTFDNCENNVSPLLGFLYSSGIYTSFAVPGVSLNIPYGINNQGVISSEYEDTNGYWHSYLIEP